MNKGILHIKKKPRHILVEGKKVPIKKEVPEIDSEFDKYECQFEGNPAMKIIVGGKEFAVDTQLASKKAEETAMKNVFVESYNKLLTDQQSNGDSFVLYKARIPKDTREQVLLDVSENFNLKLNKFARWEIKDNSKQEEHFKFFLSQDIKEKIGKDKVTLVKSFCIKPNFGNLFNTKNTQLSDRILTSAEALFPGKGQLLTTNFKPEWRFVTGLGGHSVYETGITLHHIYGVPYIPASSIKGVLRSWIIFKQFGSNSYNEEDLKGAEKRALQDKSFCDLFGCITDSVYKEARQGLVTFFDAFPTEAPTIEPDIMNPHYPSWYGGSGTPVDTDSPNPIFFLTVKNTPFQFILGTKAHDKEKYWNLENKEFWGKTLKNWLADALSEHGIGAKTAVGYGYMTKSDQ